MGASPIPASSTPEQDSPSSLEQLGKFRLIARLGTGGMGEAVLAMATGAEGFRKLVVIKRLHARFSDNVKMRDLFLQEARLAARLNHPNVVQTHEVGVQDGTMVMSMEYLEGQPVSRLARAWPQPADPRIVARIVSDALMGLEYAHELRDFDGRPLKLVHRDVSPHNLFVTYEGVVKVLDFGIAKAASQASDTESGVLKGKVAYMSPEQLTQGELDRRADVFCAGIVLWELLCGRSLLPKDSMQKTFYALLNEAMPAPSSVVPGLPPQLDGIAMRALQKDPAKRYQTARAMRDDLESYLGASGPPIRPEEIGSLVSSLFEKEHQAVRDRIREMIVRIDDDASSSSLPMLTEQRGDVTGSSQKSRLVPVDVAVDLSELGPSPLAKRKRLVAVALVGAAVVGIGGWAMVRRAPAPAPLPIPASEAPGSPSRSGGPAGDPGVRAVPPMDPPSSTSAAQAPARTSSPVSPPGRTAVVVVATPHAPPAPPTAVATAVLSAPQPPPTAAPATSSAAPAETAPAKRKFRTEL